VKTDPVVVASAVSAGTLAGFAAIAEGLFGVPVAVFAGAAGGTLLAIIRLEPGDRFASWTSIAAHYFAGVFATSLALSYWEGLKKMPAGGVAAVVAFALFFVLPGATKVLQKGPEALWSRWFGRGQQTPAQDSTTDDKGAADGR
jgi:drug/metabolite transporter (DMT)-like permease